MKIEIAPTPRRRPKDGAWSLFDTLNLPTGDADRWFLGSELAPEIVVLSAVERAEYGSGIEWQFHISVSANGRRADNDAVKRALLDFDMEGAEEDNHDPGIARHFWLPVNKSAGVITCECKDTEKTIVEADGYTYQKLKMSPRWRAWRGP